MTMQFRIPLSMTSRELGCKFNELEKFLNIDTLIQCSRKYEYIIHSRLYILHCSNSRIIFEIFNI